MQRRTLLAAVMATPLAALQACSDGGTGAATPPARAGVNDITPTPRDKIRDGGQMVWPIADIPPTFNFLQLDGTLRDNFDIVSAILPAMFTTDARGASIWNKEFLAAEPKLESGPKQVVRYTLSEQANWNDGTPITYADFKAQWEALNGRNEAFKVANSNGYKNIESVARGAGDREVVVTFARPYTDWQAIFTPLYPKAATAAPETFNNGWIKRMPGPTAGPFTFGALDETAKTVTLERDPRWWGDKAKLDRIIFKGIDASAAADAVDNGEADFFEIGAGVNLHDRAGQMAAKVHLKRAGAPFYRHITINGSKPHLADPRVRQALSMAIDRATIAKALLGPLGLTPQVLNNRIYMLNHAKYRDNAGAAGAYRPDQAKALLDQAGWRSAGATRTKDGATLALDLVISAAVAEGKTEAELIRTMLEQVGVAVTIRAVPGGEFFSKNITPGNFDLALFAWGGRPYPISINESIFAKPRKSARGGLDFQQNRARIGTQEIDDLFGRANAELNPAAAAEIANQIDTELWALLPNIPMYQRPDLWAVRKNLVNFGAFAYASKVYQDIGWLA